MSWPTEKRDPHEAYVLFLPDKNKYIRFDHDKNYVMSHADYICYATFFPTERQAKDKLFRLNGQNVIVRKIVIGD
jgi:hypothetical protein